MKLAFASGAQSFALNFDTLEQSSGRSILIVVLYPSTVILANTSPSISTVSPSYVAGSNITNSVGFVPSGLIESDLLVSGLVDGVQPKKLNAKSALAINNNFSFFYP